MGIRQGVHTMEDDLENLKALAEGSVITIDNYDYKIIGGKFVKIKEA